LVVGEVVIAENLQPDQEVGVDLEEHRVVDDQARDLRVTQRLFSLVDLDLVC
jgi:hypothetical protein